MSTTNNLRRASLFNRRFALSRKAAQSLPNGRTSIRQDAEGFDDLDDYFAASPAKPVPEYPKLSVDGMLRNSFSKSWTVTEDYPSSPKGEDRPAYREIEMDVVPLNDDYADEVEPHHTLHDVQDPPMIAFESITVEGDEEVSFKPLVKAIPSPTSLASATASAEKRSSNRSSKSTISTPTERKSKTRATRAPRQDFTPLVDVTNVYDSDGRRSKRQRMTPLAFWRNEKVVYGRRQSAKMPVIVDVLRTDAEKSPTKQPRAKRHRKGSKPKRADLVETEKALRAAGYREGVSVEAKVMDYDNHEEAERLIALGPDQVEAKPVKGENFFIQTIFTEGTFLSSGILEFPPKSSKPARNSSKHVLVFFVVEGLVEVNVHETSFIAGAGCQFIIPRGNQYSIRSAESNITSRLFFCHCKGSSSDE